MMPADLLREGEHLLTVCNACRYCEGYCAVWKAMEDCISTPVTRIRFPARGCGLLTPASPPARE